MSLRLFLVLALFPLLAACTSITVKQLGGSSSDLSSYDSYRWSWPPLDDVNSHSIDLVVQDTAVRQAVSEQMRSRGVEARSHSQASDLAFAYQFRFIPEEYADLSQPEPGWVWKRDESGELKRSQVELDAKVTVYRMALRITVFDADKQQVLWDAEVSQLTDRDGGERRMATTVNRMIDRLFKQFPDGK